MGGSYREALAKVQSDRRYAEITASFNGLNLRSEYPALSREEHGAIIRVAKQVLAEGAWDSDQPEVQPQPTPPIAPVTPTYPQPPEVPEAKLDLAPARSKTAATLDDTPKVFIDASEPPLKKGNKKTTVGLVAITALAAAIYVTISLWTPEQPITELSGAGDTGVVATDTIQEPPVGASDTPQTEAAISVIGASDTPETETAADVVGMSEAPEAETVADVVGTSEAPEAETATNVLGTSGEPSVDVPVQTPSAERVVGSGSSALVEEVSERIAVPEVEPALTMQAEDLAEDQPATSDPAALTAAAEPPLQVSSVAPSPEPDATATGPQSEISEPPTADVALNRQPNSQASTSATDDRTQTSVTLPAQTAPEETAASATTPTTQTPLNPAFNRDVDPGLVRNIQLRLSAQGFDPGPIDGIMGWRTHRAIRAYQRSKGIPVDGEATELLLGSLVSYSGSRAQ